VQAFERLDQAADTQAQERGAEGHQLHARVLQLDVGLFGQQGPHGGEGGRVRGAHANHAQRQAGEAQNLRGAFRRNASRSL